MVEVVASARQKREGCRHDFQQDVAQRLHHDLAVGEFRGVEVAFHGQVDLDVSFAVFENVKSQLERNLEFRLQVLAFLVDLALEYVEVVRAVEKTVGDDVLAAEREVAARKGVGREMFAVGGEILEVDVRQSDHEVVVVEVLERAFPTDMARSRALQFGVERQFVLFAEIDVAARQPDVRNEVSERFFERVVREGDLSLVQKQFADGEIELRRGRFFAFDGYGCFTVDGRFRFRRTLFGSFDQSEQVVAAAPVDFELGADAGGIDSANIVLHRAQIAVPQVEIERIDVDDPVVAAVAQFQPRCGRYAVRAQVEQVVGVAFHMQVECDEALYRADVDHLIEIGRCACQREVRKQQTEIVIQPNGEAPTGYLEIQMKNGLNHKLYATDITELETLVREYGFDPVVNDIERENWFLTYMLPMLAVLAVGVFLFMMMNAQQAGGGNGKMMNFGKSRAKMSMGDKSVTFAQVAGLKEEKEELEEIVDFLKEPGKYTGVGARIPKGVLLEGPPGTGKTLLAKAVAGEAGVPFFSISGSDFVEMFVGVGASRVRDLFEEAKHNAPCIVFIDEIDAVARRRGTGMGGGHDEREQTLNQLLVEMDGFGVNEGIIVMAATNRVDILDPAILRPGRFDRKVAVGTPDVGGREEILKVHAKNKPLGDDVNLQQLAQTTAGFTGADLENLLNEAAIIAAKENRSFIANKDVKRAFVKVGIGAEKKSRIISDKEKKITAYHEAGHAILFHVLPDVGPVYTVSIIPTGVGAAGYTMPLPEKDEMFATKSRMLQDIMVSLGGRIAEEIIFGDITTGASSDIKKATKTARRMVTRYGMSDNIGVICYDDDDDEVFIGKDLAHAKAHSEEISGEIDKEVKRIIDDCYTKAKDIIMQHENVLHSCAKLLLEKEKINREEFEALFV